MVPVNLYLIVNGKQKIELHISFFKLESNFFLFSATYEK